MTIPVDDWKHWIMTDRGNAQKVAERIIGNLVGYQKTTTYREEDTRSLANAIRALQDLAVGGGDDE